MMQLNEIDSKEIVPGLHGKMVHGERISWVFWDADQGVKVPEHNHMHEQIMHVVEGQFEFTLNGDTQVYGPGSVIVIPSNATHSGIALSTCKLMDVFSPVREEYR